MKAEMEKIILEFFNKLWIKLTSLDIDEKEENIFFVKINTPESGLLIWTHGITFEAIQSILRAILNNKFDKKIKVHFEINDYIHNKDAKLFAFIDKEIKRAKETWRNMKLPRFSAYERKKIHDYVWNLNDPEIFTESRWEWIERRLYIILEKNKNFNSKKIKEKISLSIDLDWDDI